MGPIIGVPILSVNRNSYLNRADNIGMSIGTRIRDARKQANLTQGQLAARVGVKQSTISELETGESAGTTLIASFAKELGVPALWLETGKGEPYPQHAQKPPEARREARMVLAYEDEEELLDLYRRSDPRGKFEILARARREGRSPPAAAGSHQG